MKKTLFTISLILGTLASSYSQISEDYQLKQASKASYNWFKNINSANYPAAWEDLSIEVQNNFNKEDWLIGINRMMNSFGEFSGRKEVSREFKSSLEVKDLPDGYYAIFQYESNYKYTLNHSEQLILHQDHKQKWRVLDYSYDFNPGEGFIEE